MSDPATPAAASLQRKPALGPVAHAAGFLAESLLLRAGRDLWAKNQKDWNLPLSKCDKLRVGVYLVLKDYSQGAFPPTFEDQQQAYRNEVNYRFALPGMSPDEVLLTDLRKPFWFGHGLRYHLKDFLKLAQALEQARLTPPAQLLELGGGTGWTAEFLALLGFKVVSTTLSPLDVEAAAKRIDALRARTIPFELRFLASPMETVAEVVKEHCPFDAAFVYEALHHAFDWKAAIASAFACLRLGGWLLVCGEPNVLHTAVSYRVAKLTKTHEIGFSKPELVAQLKRAGFQRVISFGQRPHLFFRHHWLMAQK
jgi:SAM-dependent methyltransferase